MSTDGIVTPNHPTTPPKRGQKANFYNYGLMSMKFCMEVTFRGIQLKRNTSITLKPPLMRKFGNFDQIWMKLVGKSNLGSGPPQQPFHPHSVVDPSAFQIFCFTAGWCTIYFVIGYFHILSILHNKHDIFYFNS